MAGFGLVGRLQGDFSAGMFRNVGRQAIPANGAYDLENCLLDDAGQAPRRGGSTYLTSAAFGAGLTWLWAGEINGVGRTLLASETSFGVLSEDGTTVTSLGGSGLHWPVRAALVKNLLVLPGGVTFNGTALGTAAKIADVYAAAGGRLLACTTNQVFMSNRDDPATFDPTNFHELPGGVRIIGAEGTRDRAAIFTTQGVWLISGVELDLTDDLGNPQQSLDLFSRDLVLWGESGLAGWAGGLVVPALDGVWLMSVGQDAAAAPPPFQKISGPITDLYTSYVRSGYRPGGAVVHRSHYFLPILNGPLVVDVLVARLDRVVDQVGSRGWTRVSGHAGQCSAFAIRQGGASRQPSLIGAQRDSTSRVSTMSFFDTTRATDSDGSAFRWQIVTRDFDTGTPQVKNLVRRVRVDYVLNPATGASPVVEAAYAAGEPIPVSGATWGSTTWGGSTWASADDAQFTVLSGTAPTCVDGETPYTWAINHRAERVRFRLRVADFSGRAALSSIEAFIRPFGRS